VQGSRKAWSGIQPVLFVIEDDHGTQEAVREIVDFHLQGEIRVYLLNVRTQLPYYVSRFINKKTIARFHEEAGMNALKFAIGLLDSAGVPHWNHVEVGEKANEIVRFARDRHCRRIIIAQHGIGVFSKLFLESTATRVRRLIAEAGGLNIICDEY
jgi:nucleotide-binding universal stress UspA family protein